MRTKLDFITNSSSTSYVMLGYTVERSDRFLSEEFYEEAEKLGYSVFVGTDGGAPDNNLVLIGEIISEFNDEYPDEFKEQLMDLDELKNKSEEIKKKLDLPDSLKPKIISSTRMS